MTRRIEISFSEEDIENILYDDKFTLDVLAKKYNVSRNLISVRLRELGREDISSRLIYRKNNSRNINNPGKNINGRLKAILLHIFFVLCHHLLLYRIFETLLPPTFHLYKDM